nr:MAG TPA: tail assembly chaperone protein [Bacteriophage sp.]
MHYACVTHLRWTEEIFWNSTFRKIFKILEIDRQVNSPKRAKKRPQQKEKNQKISVAEAMKLF